MSMTIDNAISNMVKRIITLESTTASLSDDMKELSENSGNYSLVYVSAGTSGKTVTATITNGETVTETFDSNGKCTFKLKYAGDYTITSNGITVTVTVPALGSIVNTALVPSFNNASWSTISSLLTMHYNGDIDLTDYWKVGDIKENVSLSAMSATGVGESQSAQTVDLVIIGTNHDTISSNSKKAAFTITQKDSLSTKGYMNSSYSSYTYAKYSSCSRRTWINNIYYNALPSELQSLIKTVNKTTAEPASSSERPTTTIISSTEKCFIPSCYEMFGTSYTYSDSGTSGVNKSDGTQYEYYKTTNNRLKYLGKGSSTFSYPWTRSGFVYSDGDAGFVIVYADGSASGYYASGSNGVCPAFCI
jgi:hypothetical protein